MPISEIYNEDCMAGMTRYPDKYFDLAIVDPIYGCLQNAYREANHSKLGKTKNYHNSIWSQKKTGPEYFKELFRISKNQIIWGANYFELPGSRCWIVWDKDNSGDFADAELAYTSFDLAVRIFKFRWNGMLQENMKDKEDRIHPTQKPIQLYKWLLKNYAKKGDKIIDTHLGSQSSRIACYDGGFDFWGWEIDADYFRDGCKRFENFKAQGKLF
jgi:site-specific DNA-methyltransferase (adenine-specific)